MIPKMKFFSRILFAGLILALLGCEETNLRLATEAGIDAVRAITLTDSQVRQFARKAAEEMDAAHRIAPAGSPHSERLQRLVSEHRQADGHTFNYKVYLSPEVNAFAMADGTIRVYSGLMDLMNDDELRFVIGHEMGHVIMEHSRKKMIMAMAGAAVRKGIAAQENIVGDLVRSGLGTFLEIFINAQYSQEEERAADDYALGFMRQEGYNTQMAVSALKKLAGPGSGYSFLSSHPDPEERADRLRQRLEHPEGEVEDKGFMERIWGFLKAGWQWLVGIVDRVLGLLNPPDPEAHFFT